MIDLMENLLWDIEKILHKQEEKQLLALKKALGSTKLIIREEQTLINISRQFNQAIKNLINFRIGSTAL